MQAAFKTSLRAPALASRSRLATGSLRSLRARTYATESSGSSPAKNPGQPFGNYPLYLSTVGLVGIGYWVFSTSGDKPKPPTAKATVSALDKDKFVEFPLAKKEQYNHNSTTFTFSLPEGTGTLLPVAGLVLVKAADENGPKDKKGNPIVRPYTPVSASDTPGELTLLVKKYDTGKFTPYLFDLKVGDKIAFKGPLPKIPYKPNEFDQIAMIAGGSGITPMYQVLTHALNQKDDKTKFKLIYANVSPSDILLKSEFDQLAKKYPERFEAVYVVDKADEKWTGYKGYVTPEILKEHVTGPEGGKVKIYVCGPPGQVAAISGPKDGMKQGALGGTLKELGYTEDHVFKF